MLTFNGKLSKRFIKNANVKLKENLQKGLLLNQITYGCVANGTVNLILYKEFKLVVLCYKHTFCLNYDFRSRAVSLSVEMFDKEIGVVNVSIPLNFDLEVVPAASFDYETSQEKLDLQKFAQNLRDNDWLVPDIRELQISALEKLLMRAEYKTIKLK
jgi:hypothetical protein